MKKEELMKKRKLGEGETSICYELQNQNVFNEFNSPLSLSEIEKFKHFLKYENKSFLFPFDFVYDEKYFYGYITKRARGLELHENILKSDLEKLSKASSVVEEDIDFISQGNILIRDLHAGNIIYDDEKLQIIDQNEYIIKPNYDIVDVIGENSKTYRIMFTNLFKSYIFHNKESRFILQKLNKYENSGYSTSEIIIKLKEDIEKHYKEEINTLEEFDRLIRK